MPIFHTSVLFLGHVLPAEGISVNPEKVEKLKTWPVPKNIKEVESFLGLASYYRWFIQHFAKKTWCLHELVGPTASKPKKNARAKGNKTAPPKPDMKLFKWMMKHQEAFVALKEALSTAPVLGYPIFTREFILETDASLNGLGTTWSQQGKDGKIHVIAYARQSLHPSERSMHNYSSAKLELLALKWAVTEIFAITYWAHGSKFTWITICLHMYKIANWVHHKSDGLVSWHCSILQSNTIQAAPTRLQMH